MSTIFDDKMQATHVIPLWKMERVPTDWKMTARTNIESDVFMMMSMLFFEGTVDFQCPILNAVTIFLLNIIFKCIFLNDILIKRFKLNVFSFYVGSIETCCKS